MFHFIMPHKSPDTNIGGRNRLNSVWIEQLGMINVLLRLVPELVEMRVSWTEFSTRRSFRQ